MCGIAGLILSTDAPRPDPVVISRLIDSLHHRGPDGTGHAVVGRVALLHNRLAIIDLVTGDQPFFAGSATLVANGEVYNYRELRAAMPGVSYATNSGFDITSRVSGRGSGALYTAAISPGRDVITMMRSARNIASASE